MPIILPKPYEPSERVVALSDVATMIEDAMTGDEPVDLYTLAEEIVDHLRPRSGASLTAMRGWLDCFRAEHPGALPRPRIRVRAATSSTP